MPIARALTKLKRNEIVAFLIALLCSFILFPIILNLSIHPCAGSSDLTEPLDPSYRLALSKANLLNLNWGKEFVFTYGPLSYLPLKLGWGINKYQFLLFDLFICLNFFCLFYSSYLNAHSKILALLLIISTTVLLPVSFGPGYSIVLLAFLLYWIVRSLEQPNLFFDVMQLSIVLLVFFIKFNSGLIAWVFFITGLLFRLLFSGENKIRLAVYFLFSFVGVFVLAKILNVALAAYIVTGASLIAGYNDVMFLDHNYSSAFIISILISVLLIAVIAIKLFSEKNNLLKKLLIFFLFTCSLYVLYKQSFVRADLQHTPDFCMYVLLFVLCVGEFLNKKIYFITGSVLLFVVLMCWYATKNQTDHLNNLETRIHKDQYLKCFNNYTDTSSLFLFPNNNQLPGKIKDKIANSRVDIYPWNLHLLFENRLNYRPRPVCQSYTAYTPLLENLNFEFYNSSLAPDFVFYEFFAIDTRYPLFDESKMNLNLLKNYTCVDTFGFAGRPVLLLQKKKNFKKVTFRKVREYTINTDEGLTPKVDHFYQLSVHLSLRGKLVSLATHSPEFKLEIKTKNGSSSSYRSSGGLVETGIFSNYLINGTADFYNYMRGDYRLDPEHEIVSYSIRPVSGNLFAHSIKVIDYEILQK